MSFTCAVAMIVAVNLLLAICDAILLCDLLCVALYEATYLHCFVVKDSALLPLGQHSVCAFYE